MTPNPSLNAAIVFAAVGLLWFLWVGWFRQQDVAIFRAELFQLRRELFLLLAEGNVSGTDSAYVHLRNMMNGLLRGAHRISFGQVVVTLGWLQAEELLPPATFADKVKALSPESRRALNALHDRLNREIVLHLGRVWKYSVFSPLIVYLLVRDRMGRATAKVVRVIEMQGLQYEAAATV